MPENEIDIPSTNPKKEIYNWNYKNLNTFSTWIQVASFKIECLDCAIKKNRTIIQQSVIYGLILSTISGSISITQFSDFNETARFILNVIYTLLTFNIAFITGYVKTFQIQEKLEEYLQLKQSWISFSASITAELQLPKELRRDPEIIISENKEKYLDLFKNDLEISTLDVKRAMKKLNITKNSRNNNYLPITVNNSRSLSISNIMLNTVLTQLIQEINEECGENYIVKEPVLSKEQQLFMEIINNEKYFSDIMKIYNKLQEEQTKETIQESGHVPNEEVGINMNKVSDDANKVSNNINENINNV
jgi:low affinity Fe/Cu permease